MAGRRRGTLPRPDCAATWLFGLCGSGGLALAVAIPLGHWYALGAGPYTPLADRVDRLGLEFWSAFVPVLSVLAGVGIILDWTGHERPAAPGCVMALALPVLLTAATQAGIGAARDIRYDQFIRIAADAEPVIGAIRRYEAAVGRPPLHLRQLVPDYLPHSPRPNARRYGTFGYRRSPWVPGTVDQRPAWGLYLSCSWGLADDLFVYWPTEQYPAQCYGGVTERIGRWMYVHD